MNELIYNILSTNKDLTNLVGSNIFAMIAPPTVAGDYLVYNITGEDEEKTKDCVVATITNISITIVSDALSRADEIKEKAEKAMKRRGLISNKYVQHITRVGVAQDYSEDKMVVTLDYNIKCSTTISL